MALGPAARRWSFLNNRRGAGSQRAPAPTPLTPSGIRPGTPTELGGSTVSPLASGGGLSGLLQRLTAMNSPQAPNTGGIGGIVGKFMNGGSTAAPTSATSGAGLLNGKWGDVLNQAGGITPAGTTPATPSSAPGAGVGFLQGRPTGANGALSQADGLSSISDASPQGVPKWLAGAAQPDGSLPKWLSDALAPSGGAPQVSEGNGLGAIGGIAGKFMNGGSTPAPASTTGGAGLLNGKWGDVLGQMGNLAPTGATPAPEMPPSAPGAGVGFLQGHTSGPGDSLSQPAGLTSTGLTSTGSPSPSPAGAGVGFLQGHPSNPAQDISPWAAARTGAPAPGTALPVAPAAPAPARRAFEKPIAPSDSTNDTAIQGRGGAFGAV